jgi:hypothetical protein
MDRTPSWPRSEHARDGWKDRLSAAGFRLRDHRLVKGKAAFSASVKESRACGFASLGQLFYGKLSQE